MENLWIALLSPVLAVITGIIASYFLRRSAREANNNTREANTTSGEQNEFKLITDALFKRADLQDVEIATLKRQFGEQSIELEVVRAELEAEKNSTKDLKRVNASLVRYVSKLTRLWPQGTTLPEPDEPIN